VTFVKNMMSSKSLEPYVIELDEKTGIATTIQQPTSQSFTANEVMRRYFVNKYIQASMSYNPKTYKQDSEVVRLFSSPAVYNAFKARINPNVLGGNSTITTKIKYLLFRDANSVEIRTASETVSFGSPSVTKNEILFITFFFAPDISLSMEERLINPLGFQVSNFEIGEDYAF
jgi:type IV secretion system protein VirB8